jgi:predicted DNA-binding WGR domain protein
MSPIPTTRIRAASLYFREGNSDKEYHAAIEPHAFGCIVTFAYGRRGTTLTTGTKTPLPVTEPEAHKVFDKLIAAKRAKGYTDGFPCRPYRQSGDEGTDTGTGDLGPRTDIPAADCTTAQLKYKAEAEIADARD